MKILKEPNSRNNIPKTKDGANLKNPHEFKSIKTHWIALHLNSNNNATYFQSFGFEHIPKEIKKIISNTNATTNTYKIQAINNVWILLYCIYSVYAKR